MSDKKKLLEEGTIRRFQTLANIKPLNSEYSEVLEEASVKKGAKKAAPAGGERHHAGGRGVGGHGRDKMEEKKKHAGDEAVEEAKYSEEESMEEAKYAEEESLEEAGHSYEEGSYGYEEAAMPMAEEETGGEGGEGMTAEIEDDVEEIAARLSSILSKVGSSKEVDTEEEGGAEAEPMDMGAPEEEEGSMMEAKKKGPHHGRAEEEKEKEKKKKKDVHEGLDEEEALAEELTRRVAARLVAEMRAAKAHKGPHKAAGKKMKGVSEKAVMGFDGSGTKHHGQVTAGGKPGTGVKGVTPAKKPGGLAGK